MLSFSLVALGALFLLIRLLSTLISFNSPLSKLPGPWHTKYTHLALKYHTLSGHRMHWVDDLHHKYGPVVRIAPEEAAIADMNAFAQIHKIGTGFLKTHWYAEFTPYREPGLFDMREPRDHSARRRLMAQAFSNTALLQNWEGEIRKKVLLAVSRIKANAEAGEADLLKWWTLLTTDVIAHLAFGESFHMLELGKQTHYMDALQSATMGGLLRMELPWLNALLRWIPAKKFKAMVTADQLVYEYGAGAVKNMRSSNTGMQNLFGQMLAACDAADDKNQMTDQIVRVEAANFIVAGSDTTAVSLTYLVWAVLKQPNLQRQLEEEIAGLSSELSQDELKQAPLLNSVVDETLRLYGAAPGALPRSVPSKGAVFCGHEIPAGTTVSTQAYTIHRNPEIFPNPHVFDGRRFLNKESMTPAQKTALHAFGAGSRTCIGIHLAWMELRLGAAMFFRECRGAKISPKLTDKMMEMDNRFLISPKGHCCLVTLSFRKESV